MEFLCGLISIHLHECSNLCTALESTEVDVGRSGSVSPLILERKVAWHTALRFLKPSAGSCSELAA